MALEQLIDVLRRGAEAEAVAVVAAARAEADGIRARSEAEVSQRRRTELAAREELRSRTIEEAVTAGRRAARRVVLEARQRLLDRVFRSASTRFPDALTSAEYRTRLPGLVREALGFLGGRPGILRHHPTLGPELAALVGTRAGLRLENAAEVGAGFRLATEDGAMEIDATLEDRLVRREGRIAMEIVKRLEESQ